MEPPSAQEGEEAACPLCGAGLDGLEGALCGSCRREQRRLFWVDAAGAGLAFSAVAVFLYLMGRWYAD